MSCPACFTGNQHQHENPTGEMTTLHGLSCYVTPPQSTQTQSKSTIIFYCDAFGHNLINNKLLADAYASGTGMRVIVPALPPKPVPVWVMASMDTVLQKYVPLTDIWGQLDRIKNVAWLIGAFATFFGRNASPAKVVETVTLPFTRAVKGELPDGGKLGVAGFCWGGYQTTALCTKAATPDSDTRLVDAQFTAHPSALKLPDMMVDAVKTHKVPYSLAFPTEDFMLKRHHVEEIEAQIRRLKEEDPELEFEVKVYEKQHHGFAVRGDAENQDVKKAMEDAKAQAIEWFKKWL